MKSPPLRLASGFSAPFLTATLLLVTSLAHAQKPQLLKDLDPRPLQHPSHPMPMDDAFDRESANFIRMGKAILFIARTEAAGKELWRSDATAAGTKMVKDIRPGAGSSNPGYLCLTHDGKRAFFTADDGVSGAELWVTDGTPSGTKQVLDIDVGKAGSWPREIVPFGKSSVIFVGSQGRAKSRLFVSDGTKKGTSALRDIWFASRLPFWYHLRSTRDGKRVFFTGNDGKTGPELWVTDGTRSGTALVKDIRPGSAGSNPGTSRSLGPSQIVFAADDGQSGIELWISDGTAVGTRLVLDINRRGFAGAGLYHSISFGNKVMFQGYTGATGWEPWVTDGSAKGTRLLIETIPGIQSGGLIQPHLDTKGTQVYWSSRTIYRGYRIFVSDGTPAGSRIFTPKNVDDGFGAVPLYIAESQGKIYFQGIDARSGAGRELWVSDGTVSGTRLLRDTSASGDGMALFLTRLGPSTLMYAADDDWTGMELWSLTGGKRSQRFDLNKSRIPPTRSSRPSSISRFGKVALFLTDDSKRNFDMWISNGTAAGTTRLKSVHPLPPFGYPSDRPYVVAGDKLIYAGSTLATGEELFVTDGTAFGTKLLKDLRAGRSGSRPFGLTSIGNLVYFTCDDGQNGYEPWVTDGTPSGTRLLADLAPGPVSSMAGSFAGEGDRVVFRAWSNASGYELFVTDGTKTGTKLLRDIYPGTSSGNPDSMVYHGGKVYFGAYAPSFGRELWVTDFTTSGTRLLKDIESGPPSSWARYLSARHGKIYCLASSKGSYGDLFVSDGSSAGTKLFHKFPARNYASWTAAIGSRKVYYYLQNSATGLETGWTDGTATGTRVLDVYPGPIGGEGNRAPPPHHTAFGNLVVFRANHPLYGEEIFTIGHGATAEPIGMPYGSTWIHGSDPVQGKTATVEGGTKLHNAVNFTFLGSVAARSTRLGRAGFAHFDLTSYFGILGPGSGSRFQHVVSIPSSPTLKGVEIALQTLSFDAKRLTASLELSNGLLWAIGN